MSASNTTITITITTYITPHTHSSSAPQTGDEPDSVTPSVEESDGHSDNEEADAATPEGETDIDTVTWGQMAMKAKAKLLVEGAKVKAQWKAKGRNGENI